MDFNKMIIDFSKSRDDFKKHSENLMNFLKEEFKDVFFEYEDFSSDNLKLSGMVIWKRGAKLKFPKRVQIKIWANLDFETFFFEGIQEGQTFESELYLNSSYPMYAEDIKGYIKREVFKMKKHLEGL
ncbi:MAG: hypothetical protein WCO35_02245 [Candidatus Nomurabacteria bacterium]